MIYDNDGNPCEAWEDPAAYPHRTKFVEDLNEFLNNYPDNGIVNAALIEAGTIVIDWDEEYANGDISYCTAMNRVWFGGDCRHEVCGHGWRP